MKFDNIFVYTKENGRYHKLVTLCMSSLAIVCAFSTISTVFLNGNMDHYCRPNPGISNCSAPGICWQPDHANLPPDDQDTSFINETQCRMYADNETELIECKYGYIYDRSKYDSTILSEFDLVCGDSYKVSMASSVYLGGVLGSSLVFGIISDLLGRRKTAFIALGLSLIVGVLCGLAKSYYVFVICRFFTAALNMGIYLAVFSYVTEVVGPSSRAMMATIVTLFWCVGYMLISLIAYFIRSWSKLLIVSNLILIVLLPMYCFVPESARWLLVKGRREEAKRVLQRFAKGNKMDKLSDEILDNLEVETASEKKMSNPLVIVRYPSMLKQVINMTYSWFSVNLVYFGLTYGVEGLNVDVYIGTFLGGFTEVFAYVFSWFVIQRFGRRCMLSGTLVAGGIACFINIWIPLELIEFRTTFSMIGKFFITSAFAIVYVFTAEIFPTDIRTIGLGICSFWSRVAAVLAPQILFLEKLWGPLPLVTFSATSVSAGLLALLLPETLNVPLPQTIEEAVMMKRKISERKGGFHEIGLHPMES